MWTEEKFNVGLKTYLIFDVVFIKRWNDPMANSFHSLYKIWFDNPDVSFVYYSNFHTILAIWWKLKYVKLYVFLVVKFESDIRKIQQQNSIELYVIYSNISIVLEEKLLQKENYHIKLGEWTCSMFGLDCVNVPWSLWSGRGMRWRRRGEGRGDVWTNCIQNKRWIVGHIPN